jgi:hypothetical protein
LFIETRHDASVKIKVIIMVILNLTQHAATSEQVAAGVVDLMQHDLAILKGLLNFVGLPTGEEVYERAYQIARLAESCFVDTVMIGGAPFLMAELQKALQVRGITVLYAFSERVSVEKIVDGVVIKTNEFKHTGFVEVFV